MAVAQIHNLIYPTFFSLKMDLPDSGLSVSLKLSYAGISVGTTKFQTQALS
jgi:hypothetical protein